MLQEQNTRTRRDEIYDYICEYAHKHNGPTPSIREVAFYFDRSYSTVYRHIQQLVEEQRLEWRDGKLIVVESRWLPPHKHGYLTNQNGPN